MKNKIVKAVHIVNWPSGNQLFSRVVMEFTDATLSNPSISQVKCVMKLLFTTIFCFKLKSRIYPTTISSQEEEVLVDNEVAEKF